MNNNRILLNSIVIFLGLIGNSVKACSSSSSCSGHHDSPLAHAASHAAHSLASRIRVKPNPDRRSTIRIRPTARLQRSQSDSCLHVTDQTLRRLARPTPVNKGFFRGTFLPVTGGIVQAIAMNFAMTAVMSGIVYGGTQLVSYCTNHSAENDSEDSASQPAHVHSPNCNHDHTPAKPATATLLATPLAPVV